jgi:AmmeMemoRadiSam system protein B
MSIRPPAVAGLFYPADARGLASLVDRLLDEVGAAGRPAPRALIAPHAGYAYSGAVAASAYACLRGQAAEVRRVVILGTAHRTQRPGLHASSHDAFATPLGTVAVDRPALAPLLSRPEVSVDDTAHERDHAIEVQLPFLQRVRENLAIVPFLVGAIDPDDLADILAELAGGSDTLVVVSSDLSHYQSQREAEQLDRRTAERIASLDTVGLDPRFACGAHAIRGLLRWGSNLGLQGECLDLRTSADAGGEANRVVGYGAFRFDMAG